MSQSPTFYSGFRSRRLSSSGSHHSTSPPSTTAVGQTRQAGSVITQADLARIQELRANTKECEHLRDLVISLHEQGAVVEPGELTFEITVTESRRLSAKSLRPIIGNARVEELQNAVEVTRSQQLMIKRSR